MVFPPRFLVPGNAQNPKTVERTQHIRPRLQILPAIILLLWKCKFWSLCWRTLVLCGTIGINIQCIQCSYRHEAAVIINSCACASSHIYDSIAL